MDYSDLDDDEFDDDTINYDEVSAYAKAGLKNPRMIAHAMGLPVDWFLEIHKEAVDLAIERGLAHLALETTAQIRTSAREGDFQAQKYILQNIDDTWTDKREVINKNEIDIKGLPSLNELFSAGLTASNKEKLIGKEPIDGEFTEE